MKSYPKFERERGNLHLHICTSAHSLFAYKSVQLCVFKKRRELKPLSLRAWGVCEFKPCGKSLRWLFYEGLFYLKKGEMQTNPLACDFFVSHTQFWGVIVVLLKKLVHRPGRLWVDGKGERIVLYFVSFNWLFLSVYSTILGLTFKQLF